MTAPHTRLQAEANPARSRPLVFRKHSKTPPPTPEQSRRQGDVVRSAWRHFGEAGPVIAFLNTRQDVLGGHPLHLAIESDAGLERVQTLLEDLTLEA